MPYLDEVDDSATKIGAVNTVVNHDGLLTGTNTDFSGGIKALKEEYGKLDDAHIVVLGAGGAARAIVYGLAQCQCTVTVLNRTLERAKNLVSNLKDLPATLNYGPLKDVGKHMGDAGILVNATPIGMYPKTQDTPIPSILLRPGLVVYDVVYNPLKTRLMREAEAAGARSLGGVKMLVYQGTEAFRLWTGRDPPTDLMLKTVMDNLRESP
jgi:shikimate dehydrogenase